MSASPEPLLELCLNYVCANIEQLYTVKKLSRPEPVIEHRFVDSGVYLPSEITVLLLEKLSVRHKLNDEVLSLFNAGNVNLENIILPTAKKLTTNGLRVLKKHKVIKIQADFLNCTINELVDLLGEWTKQNLKSLYVPNSLYVSDSCDFKLYANASLSKLVNLRDLDISNTEFNTHNLMAVVDLPHLESLDISNTKVNTLLPLEKKKNQLRKLIVYNLKKATMNVMAFELLRSMTSLKHLDLSADSSNDTPQFKFLTDPDWLPNLVSLDVSGSGNIGPRAMEDFLNNHKELKFLGLMFMEDSILDMFTVPTHPLYNPDLEVSGIVKEEHLLTSLSRYKKRPKQIDDCLKSLLILAREIRSPRVDIIEIILNVMSYLSDYHYVQESAASCLQYLTFCDFAFKMHPSILSKVMEAILDAMERFPKNLTLHGIILSIIYNNYILLDVKMDKVKCAELIVGSLNTFDVMITNLGIATFTMIVEKMSTFELSQLGSNSQYINKLLNILSERLKAKTVDDTMYFTLNALWDLTDGAPITCEMFIDNNGLKTYTLLLNTFIADIHIVMKVLGLFYNIAEIPHLRAMLFRHNIVPAVRRFLQSRHIDVSYLAAAVIAHIANESVWETYTFYHKDDILEELENTVKQWVLPAEELVIYKSFKPLIALLNSDTPQVQIWAAWAILHVCTLNATKYCAILHEEHGDDVIRNNIIKSDKSVDPQLYRLCHRILDLVYEQKHVPHVVFF